MKENFHFDADDTLWALQEYFEEVEHEYCELLSEYGKEKEISAALLETESVPFPIVKAANIVPIPRPLI